MLMTEVGMPGMCSAGLAAADNFTEWAGLPSTGGGVRYAAGLSGSCVALPRLWHTLHSSPSSSLLVTYQVAQACTPCTLAILGDDMLMQKPSV